MVNLKKYLLILLSAKNIENTVNSDLDYTEKEILDYIAVNPLSSTYDCYQDLNNNYSIIPYENVNGHIHNLIDLGLIQIVTNLDNKNNEKLIEDDEPLIAEQSKQYDDGTYYSISSAGIFYLFKRDSESIDFELILKNKEDGLFVNFLYPYLDFKTLEEIEHFRTRMLILGFLGKCCEIIQQVLKTLRRIEEKGGESDDIGYVNGLADPEQDDCFHGPRAFILGLKNRLKIGWLDLDDTKVIEVEKNKLFKIHDRKENELFLAIYPERKVAVLSDKNHKIREFRLEKDPTIIDDNLDDNYAITYFNAITVEDYIDELFAKDNFYFYPDINKSIYEFCDSMMEYLYNEYLVMNKEERIIKREDCIAIAKDKNFQRIVSLFKQKIDSYYEVVSRLSHLELIK